MYVEFVNETCVTLSNEQEIILLDALAMLVDAHHWARADETDHAQMVMDLYQMFGAGILDREEYAVDREDNAD